MATQNIAIPTGENASILAMLANHIFENHNKEMGDAVINKNFVLAYLNKKAERVEVGGLDFAEPVLTTANSNFAFRNKYSAIDANQQDPTREFRFDPVTLSGTIVINRIHELMNTGKSQIRKLAMTYKQQAETTASNLLNAAMWDSSPTANIEPESLISLISTTPTTGTIGGITRVGNAYAQNKVHSATVSSVGSAAGLAVVHKFRAQLGGDARTIPDFAVTTATIWGLLLGFMDNNRRLMADEQLTKLGVENFYISPSCLLGYDGDAGLATDGTTAGCP
ncbi:MAG TPA: phage major capsid protein, partial [Blastocatellia bacterium]|nr:phage major capsid protein [Blastocatellia bacterium]